eukprot:TRINITY_DN31622_c0_g1_i1.p2 TRINITY_DN31622_c0_g1~~TRINITY_DN31622_c0_g1_i1.p2  ORF type:complete len:146 (-),score=39.09 TRINITY_DN31622_c0_g1_i1:75-512(-)
MVLIPKKTRKRVYRYLFKEGVVVCKLDYNAKTHAQIDEVPNLHIMKLMQSLKSKGYVRETYNWRFLYYVLTDEGIEYLREFLYLPPDVVPDTLKKQARPMGGGRSLRNDGEDGGRKGKDGKSFGGDNFKPNYGRGRGRGQYRAKE